MVKSMSLETTIQNMAKAARDAAREIGTCSADVKNAVLLDITAGLQDEATFTQQENEKDLARAKEMGVSAAMIDRLTVTDATIQSMVDGLREVAQLNDPVGALNQTKITPFYKIVVIDH
jgi:glutamate-5-semialdehyde dehydrogenase